MNINIRPGRVVPQDHVEWLISRYGFKKIFLAVLTHSLRRKRLGMVAKSRPTLGQPPQSAHLRRDIGLPPPMPSAPPYWDLR